MHIRRFPMFAAVVCGLVALCRPLAAVAQTSDPIVLYAAAGVVNGARWVVVADAQAAGGAEIFNADKGEAKLTTPLAMPASYVDLTFTAPANVAYHLWLRMKAQGDAFSNDSVYVQFSDSLTTSGAANFRIGTTNAMAVVLEEGSNAGLSGWGWADNNYGGLGVNVKFAAAGRHRVRIQQREDGVRIDQIVLSPSTYLTTSPGATKQDTTILPADDGSAGPPPPAGQIDPIVLYAAAGAVNGARWEVVADAQAAGGAEIFNADKGEAKLTTPLAMPASYVDLTFTAPANVAYHLWLRMKAQGDAFSNDSVYVQFSDSLTTSGAANFRIGTTNAMAVVLEEGSNAGLSGWGWADNNYGGLGVNVKFAAAGRHRVRIQQREDGVRIDQIVLSPSTYLTTSPGATKQDTAILPANDGSGGPPPPAGSGFKVATWNIRSGEGRCPISGTCPFVDSTQNCTNPSQPMNAWGLGILQAELTAINQDASLIAIGLQEAWTCGQPSNVNDVLHWAYASGSFNGTALVARYGIHGTLETKVVSVPSGEPAYVLGANVCVNAACSAALRVYVAHLTFFDLDDRVVDPVILAQTQTMLDWIATRPHADKHILVGDLNAFEREPAIDFRCELTFDYQTPKAIRDAGYTDAWLALHGTTPGMTATLDRNGCGVTNGGPWKRIDYGYLKGLTPASSSFFAFVPANTAAPSDHYGLLTGFTGRTDATASNPPGGSIVLLRRRDSAARRR